MLENLFLKIGLKYSRFKFRKFPDDKLRFSDFISECNKILIILPYDPKQYDEAKDVIIELKNKWAEKEITVIVRSQFVSINEFKEHFHTIGMDSEDVNRFFLPKRKFFNELLLNGYDLVIDLNLDLYLPVAFLTKVINSKFRIGIKKELADLFYNFQFDPLDYRSFKIMYSKLFNNLNMFG